MKLKTRKIKHIILLSLMLFLAIVILLLFTVQIVMLNRYYEIYKTNQLERIVDSIIKSDSITTNDLENIAFENGVCISVLDDGINQNISTIYNRGCIFSDKITSEIYINMFIDSNKQTETYIVENNRFKNKTIIKAIKYNDMYIFLNTSLEALDSSIELIKSQYIYIVIALVITGIIIAYIISKEISKPIENLSNSANQLANGKFDTSFKTDSQIYEIKELSNILERAKNELSKTDQLRRDLMANVGHDLRTPLTMIKAYAEMTRDFDNQSEQKKKENMGIIIEETDRLNTLVSDILDLSKLQSETYELKLEDFDLDELIKSIIKRYYILIDNEGYEFIYNNDEKIIVRADKKRIEQVIYNLINNAINYTGKDKKIYINVMKIKNKVLVEIKDTGKGIDNNEIDSIWDKYYHNDKKYKRNTFGTGLGLSIVKTILETHHYKYGVKSIKDKGTTFYFEISKTK